MLVQKKTYADPNEAPTVGAPPVDFKDRHYYRVGESLQLQEVTFDGGVEKPKRHWLWWLVLPPALVCALYLVVRCRRRGAAA